MPIRDAFLSEFDQEMANTRKVLERVPDDKLDWRPHAKSGTLGWLAGHVAGVPGWCKETINLDALDLAPGGKPMEIPSPPKSRQEILELFDRCVAAGRTALSTAEDAHLMKPWSLLMAGKTLMTMPRVVVLRSMVMNHHIHHRAQLTVYLRLLDVPVPGLYGPSADEGKF